MPTTLRLPRYFFVSFTSKEFSPQCKNSNVIIATVIAIRLASSMFISMRFVVGVAFFAPLSRAATYFVDPNCDASYSGISQTSFPEAWNMARNALEVANAGDANEQFIYGKLFKEGVKETINGVAGSIFFIDVHTLTVTSGYFEILGGLTPAAKAEDADLIFDCDNDARWKPVMEGDVQRGEGSNKQWKDEKYHMRAKKEFPSCVRDPPAIASTYRNSVERQGWQNKRTVVSLCKRISRSYGNWATVSKFEDKLFDGKLKDPKGKEQDVPSWLNNPCTSRTILHEAFHSNLIEPHSTYLPTNL
jgi:hypothetical protein